MPARIVAHYLSHRILKGTTLDFSPDRDHFHVLPVEARIAESDILDTIWVPLSDLKGIFFVKDYWGNPTRKDRKDWSLRKAQGARLVIRFKDGEEMWGYSHTYSATRECFFVTPCDPESNNERVYVNRSAVEEVMCEQAPAAAQATGGGSRPV